MIDKNQVAAALTALRRRAGYSQSALAKKLGVSAQAVSKWETGMKSCSGWANISASPANNP